MGFRSDIKRCSVFNEFSSAEQKQYFGITRDKVIFNIDTLYYTCCLYEDREEDVTQLLRQFKIWKEEYSKDKKDILFFDMHYRPLHFSIYEHCMSIENMFDIFFSSYLPNKDTPRIVVQLRSVGLWQKGIEEMIKYSLDHLNEFLKPFNLDITTINVNRIDYAYHSNLIQNTSKFLNDRALLNNLKSKLRIYQKVGNISDTVEVDYLALGNRKSNNIFFRTYNKTREVVEQNYKGFFIEVWHKNGLISEYDKYCLEAAYKQGSYAYLNIARIDWYVEHGSNEVLKTELLKIRNKYFVTNDNYTYIRKALRNVLPEVTTIMNVEYQTKTKFFHSIEGMLKWIPDDSVLDVPKELQKLTKIIRNSRIITDYLTSETVAFFNFKSNEYLAWWKRIRECKVDTMFKGALMRHYGRNIDLNRLKQKMLISIASISSYKTKQNTTDLTDDISSVLCVLNDNDMHKIILNADTGEQVDFVNGMYRDIKKRKYRQLKPLLEETGEQKNDN